MTTIRKTYNKRPSKKDTFISTILAILIIGLPFILFIIPLSTKNTTDALDVLNQPEGQWEMVNKTVERDSIFTPSGNAKAEYIWGNNVENTLAAEFNTIAESITNDEIATMQSPNNYHYSCVDNANICTVAYTKEFNETIGKHTVIITRIKGDDIQTLYPDKNNYTTLVTVTVSEQPYQS